MNPAVRQESRGQKVGRNEADEYCHFLRLVIEVFVIDGCLCGEQKYCDPRMVHLVLGIHFKEIREK